MSRGALSLAVLSSAQHVRETDGEKTKSAKPKSKKGLFGRLAEATRERVAVVHMSADCSLSTVL